MTHGLDTLVLYKNIDLQLRNKLHGPMHYNIGVIVCKQWTQDIYSLVVMRQSNPPISKYNRP